MTRPSRCTQAIAAACRASTWTIEPAASSTSFDLICGAAPL
jgi:hypothetical protein